MPKFSVCIPTRERHVTLPCAIQSVLNQTYGDFELIVMDNASSEATRVAVDDFWDKRVKYVRSTKRLPMHENWEVALSEGKGEYITYIGDDDALLPHCLERAAALIADAETPPELLAWPAHTYYWPNVPDKARANYLTLDRRSTVHWGVGFADDGCLRFKPGQLDTLPVDTKHILDNWLSFRGFRLYIPTYHNLVSRSVIDRVKAKTGRYFFNPLPDVATLIANLYVADEALYHTQALSMTGHSGRSAGGSHGDVAAFDRHLENFVAESGWSLEELTPTPFAPVMWNPALLAGCFEDVKRRLFPGDDRFELDWEGFMAQAVGEIALEPADRQDALRAWLVDGMQRLTGERVVLGEVVPLFTWQRTVGMVVDVVGDVAFEYVDGDQAGFRTILDAVAYAGKEWRKAA